MVFKHLSHAVVLVFATGSVAMMDNFLIAYEEAIKEHTGYCHSISLFEGA